MDENLLGKPTATTRRITFERLRELYGLDPSLLVFRALRDVWDADESAQPLLALLCATARDPILRAMTPFVLRLPVGALNTLASYRKRPSSSSQESSYRGPGTASGETHPLPGEGRIAVWQAT